MVHDPKLLAVMLNVHVKNGGGVALHVRSFVYHLTAHWSNKDFGNEGTVLYYKLGTWNVRSVKSKESELICEMSSITSMFWDTAKLKQEGMG